MDIKSVGNRLLEEIERAGGIPNVARQLGVVRTTLYNWVKKDNIPANKLLKLQELGVDPLYVLFGRREIEALPKREETLLNNYRGSDEEGKRALERTALALAEHAACYEIHKKAEGE